MVKKISRWTQLNQPKKIDSTYLSLTTPITRASTIVFDSVEKFNKRNWQDKTQYSYGLQATPITRRLEEQLAIIDNVSYALLYPSGLNAICMTFMGLLKSNDHVIIPQNSYGPTLEIVQFLEGNYHVSFSTYDPLDLSSLQPHENTRLIWVENPGSITMEICDLKKISAIARTKKILIGADTTWSAGIACNPFLLGADFTISALTKYQSGGSDVLMGAMTTNNKEIYDQFFLTRTTYGIHVCPEDCYLVLRSLPHLELRYLTQDISARKIAAWLKTQAIVETVLHPAFEDCSGHNIWKRDFRAAASIFSVVFNNSITEEHVNLILNALNLFHIGVSWGGPTSLVIPINQKQTRQTPTYQGQLIRLYIGLEKTEDLIEDLQDAFKQFNL